MITSVGNARIKRVIALKEKAKLRRDENVFVIEGVRMFQEAPESHINELYLTEEFERTSDEMTREKIKQCRKNQRTVVENVTRQVFDKISATVTPQGILGIVDQPQYNMEDLLKTATPMLLIVENIQDPGNLGTIFRTAEGAGVDGIIMSKETVDLYNPKTIRSTMGSIYRVPYLITEDLKEGILTLKNKGIKVFAAHLSGNDIYDGISFRGACAFLIGNEGNGLSDEIAALASTKIKIPMQGQVESLNAAIAAALLMYEARRQRGL